MDQFDDSLNLQEIVSKLDDVLYVLNDISEYSSNAKGSAKGGGSSSGKNDATSQALKKRVSNAAKSLGGGSLSIGKLIGTVGKLNAVLGITAGAIYKVTNATLKYNNALNESLSRLEGASTSASKLTVGSRNLGSAFSELMQTIGNSWFGDMLGSIGDFFAEGMRGLSSFIETGNPANDTRANASATENYLRQMAGISKRDLTELTSGYDALYYAIAGSGMGSARTEEGAKALFERLLTYADVRGMDASKAMAEYASMISGKSGTSSVTGASLDKNILASLAMQNYNVLPEMLGERPLTELAVTSLIEQTNTALSGGNEALVDAQREWRKYGEAIKDAKSSLFSFDKVITLDAKIREEHGDRWTGGYSANNGGTVGGFPVMPDKPDKTKSSEVLQDATEKALSTALDAATEKVTDSIKDADIEVVPGLEKVWEATTGKLATSIEEGKVETASGVSSVWSTIKTAIKTAIGLVSLPVTSGLKGIWTVIKGVVKTAISAVNLPVTSGVKGIWTVIKGVVKTAISSVTLPVATGIKNVWNWITGKIKESISTSDVKVTKGVNKISNAVTDSLVDEVSGVSVSTKDVVNKLWQTIGENFAESIASSKVDTSNGLNLIWNMITTTILSSLFGINMQNQPNTGLQGGTTRVGETDPEYNTKSDWYNTYYGQDVKNNVPTPMPSTHKAQFNDDDESITDEKGNLWVKGQITSGLIAYLLDKGVSMDLISWLESSGYTLASGPNYDEYKNHSINISYDQLENLTKSTFGAVTIASLASPFLGLNVGLDGDATLAAVEAVSGAFATGGVMTGPTYGLVGEAGNEAVIPLENDVGINYLAAAMKEAGGTSKTVVNVNLSGQVLEMNDYNVRRLGEKLGAIIDNERNRRGGLNYDSSRQQ